jgi:type II protein arginine methyltransferase
VSDATSRTSGDADRLFREALAHFQARRFAEADALLDQLAPRLGDNVAYLRLRGLVAMHRRDPGRAHDCLTRAASLAPAAAVHQIDLGDFHRASGRPLEAMRHYRQALDLDPGAVTARLALAGLLTGLRRNAEARAELTAAAAAIGEDLAALKHLALGWRELGDADAAIRTMRRVAALAPQDIAAQALLRDLQTSQVRPWHFRMMNDAARNRAYDQAIRRAVGPDSHVLEIGTGSGLLAMMAARAGARRVTTCEKVEAIAETAAEIIRLNGYGERVRVIAKASTELVLGADMPERADLLISEILSDRLLGERVLQSTADARRRLLKPGGQLIPRAIAAVVRLVGGPFFAEAASVGRVAGFDLTPFNRFAPSNISISMESGAFESLGDDVEVFRFDLTREDHRPAERQLTLTAQRAGCAVGLLQWLRLELDDEASFENAPSETVAPSAWRQVLYPFPAPIDLAAGEQLSVRAMHDLANLAFWPER